MAQTLVKPPVLGDLLKDEQERFLGRERSVFDNSGGQDEVRFGLVVQKAAGGKVEAWDMSSTPDPDTVHGILLTSVPAGEVQKVAVLVAGPAAVDPTYLVWDDQSAPKVAIGLAALADKRFIFTRDPVATGTYPVQVDA
jgi:hypothetical protein